MKEKHWLIWDGECGFCSHSAKIARQRDKSRDFQIVTYQNCPEPPMHEALREQCKTAMYVVTKEGKELRGADAVMFVLQETGLSWWWKFWRTPPMIWFAQACYSVIARNRGLISKWFFGGAECGLENRYPEID